MFSCGFVILPYTVLYCKMSDCKHVFIMHKNKLIVLTADKGDEADSGILLASYRGKNKICLFKINILLFFSNRNIIAKSAVTLWHEIKFEKRRELCVCPCVCACVSVLTARGLDMRSNDCKMRLAVALVTPQGWAPAGLALICLLIGAYRSDELI